MSIEAHLLGVPQELRDRVYAVIVRHIQSGRCTFEGNPISEYDGLRLSCRQLYKETATSIFSFAFTSHQLARIFDLRLNRTSFENVRSVSMEIPLDSKTQVFSRIKAFLICMQLSLQELRIFFVGVDQRGNTTSFHGCGKKSLSSLPGGVPLLMEQGQDFDQQWDLLRHIAILRNLRILQIENANLPLIAGMVLNNKPYLQALSITSDPRSIPSTLSRMPRASVMRLCKNIAVKVNVFPPIKVMSLSANSLSNIEGAINGVSPSLRHFSWRIPNPDYQPYTQQQCFYAVTNRLVHTLSWRAPQLETIRLCASMRECQTMNETKHQESCRLTEELSHRLPLFPALRRLEVHCNGDNGFLRQDLIGRLPPTLTRLYISDCTISITGLVSQVRKRYFTYTEDDNDATADAIPSTPVGNRKFAFNKSYALQARDEDDQSGYLSIINTSKLYTSCGEMRDRNDDIPLSGGVLGFVNFEYGHPDFDGGQDLDHLSEPVVTQILRLNGQLLDREHNLHLAPTQLSGEQYGIKCPREETEWRPAVHPQETRIASRHLDIYTSLYHMEETAPRKHIVEKYKQDLEKCLECRGSSWEWYFGHEQEAMTIFEEEPVAKVENQTRKPDIVEVEVPECSRCRWSCPDFELLPVGSFPTPVLPVDWREHVD